MPPVIGCGTAGPPVDRLDVGAHDFGASLCFGAMGAAMHGFNEYVDLESLRKSTKATALFIAEWCGVEKV